MAYRCGHLRLETMENTTLLLHAPASSWSRCHHDIETKYISHVFHVAEEAMCSGLVPSYMFMMIIQLI